MFTTRIEEFKKLCNERICYYSKNDPYIKLEKLEEKSKKAAEYYSERRLAKIWLAYYQKFSR